LSKNKYRELFSDRSFIGFWIGFLGFGLGGALYSITLNWWVLETTNSEVQLGIVGMLTFLPMLIFSFFSGIITDIFNRKKLMIVSIFLRGMIITLFPILGYLQIIEVWHVYIITFIQGISLVFFINSAIAIMPQFIKKENLLAANALTDSSIWLANIFGYFSGGFLIDSFGIMNLFILSSIVFLGSSFTFILIEYVWEKKNKISLRNFFSDLYEGVKLIKTNRKLFILIITWMGINTLFAQGPLTIGWAAFSKRILNSGAQGYGLLVTSYSFSSLIGSLLIGHWGAKFKKGTLLIVGNIWGCIGMIFFIVSSDIILAMIIVFIWSFNIPLINVPFWTFVQESLPEEELGKITGVSFTLNSAMMPISTIMTGFIMQYVSVSLPFLLLGLAYLFSFILIYIRKETRILDL
jgi:DHA3 family macrolide efflux protein-like MFS transporter